MPSASTSVDYVLSGMSKERVMASNPSENELATLAFLAKSLADENRLRILFCVGREKKSVSRIVEELSLSQPLVSHHLKELKRALLVNVERSGPFVYYGLSDERLLPILAKLGELGGDLLRTRTSF